MDPNLDGRISGKEKNLFYNSLSILLKAVEGQKTTVDLRNESSIYGLIEQADGFMNIVMKNCIFTDPRGDKFKYDIFFVHSRNIRLVHIPPNIPIIPAINSQLGALRGSGKSEKSRPTFKSKRVQQKQKEDLENVNKLLEQRTIKND
ncbi:U7 snRNA-associated Sm-like protein LSm10 [Aphidius gifuensis]|uniref:U7 snRNA-associated Sm-like protein LSm10 n=1 Tax=Aphidius gifuensis TaxID=684658 RepID=UPI001CDC4698|nr:U7 snRNA-associated Sm-like protein LSm10 [Aphidius gifuensis]